MRKELKLRILQVLSRRETVAVLALAAVLLAKHVGILGNGNNGGTPPGNENDPYW